MVEQISDIPCTTSSKIGEIAVHKAIHGQTVKNTDALANPEALEKSRTMAVALTN